MLVSEEFAMGLLRSKLLPDALLGTSVDEAAGILGPDGKWGSSGELLDLPIPDDSLGGEIPVGMFCQTQHTRVPGRADAQAPPGETRKMDRDETNAQKCPDAVLGVEMSQPQAKRKDTDRPNCTRANRCSSPFQRKAVLPRWQYLRHKGETTCEFGKIDLALKVLGSDVE